MAVKYGVTTGYGGKGVFYAWAAGNGGDFDYSTLDEYSNFYAVTAVCAVGHDDIRSSYSEAGANLWVCGPSSSGRVGQPRIATTDNGHRYRGSFGGTSAATPIVSGVVALIREANSALTWRDVKLILAASARKNDPDNTGWVEGAFKYGSTTDRYNFNHEYGFGMVDAKAAVDLAPGWTNVGDFREITSESSVINLPIPDLSSSGTPTTVTTSLTIDPFVEFVEFVEVNAHFSHPAFRDLTVELVSPSGAVSTLSTSAPRFGSLTTEFRFGSARHLGEDAAGEWTLRIKDLQRNDRGALKSWGLTIYGHGLIPGAPEIDVVTPGGGTLEIDWKAPTETGETAITSYDLRYIRDNATDKSDDNWSVVTGVGTPSNRNHTITGLTGGVKYEFQLRAHNDSGHGPWSQAEAEEPTTVAPSAPSILSITRGDRTLAVVWTAPADTGGGVITAYDVRYIETSEDETMESNWTVRDNAWRSGDLRYVISNLTNTTEYDIQVRAVNSAGDGAWSGTETGTPLPDDIPITLQWEETSIEVAEDAGSVVLRAVFTTTLDSPPEADFTFDVILTTTDSGTTQGDDYTTPASSATFVAGDFSQTDVNGQQRYRATRDFTVAIIDDTADESDEAFRVRLAYATPGLSHLQGGPSTAVVTIKDNEHVPVTLSWEQPDVTVRENAGSATLRAYAVTTEDKRPEDGFSFDASIRTSDGSATQPGDYTQVDDTVTFSRNDFSRVTVNGERRYRAVKQVQVPIQDDTSDEDEEDFTVTIEYANPGPPHLQGGPAVMSVKITDNDFVPVTISWDQSFVSVDEHARTVTLQARATTTSDRIPESGFNVALSATTADGTATQGSDYRRLTSSFSFGQGDFTRTDVGGQFRFQATRDISVSIIDDTVDEPDENFTVILNYSNPSLPHLQGGPDTATVTITDVNAPPTITTTSSSATGLRQPENRTSRLYTYRAADPEGSSITWSAGGTDGRFFTIDERGQFSFSETSPPDFEIPGDSGGDNVYNVLVQAQDDQFNTATLSVTVTVTDVNEGPAVSGRNSYTVEENQELSGAGFLATDPEGDSVTRWSLSGTDGGDFLISETGVLTFRNTPDYERPADSNRDNEYLVMVRAYDNRNAYGSLDIIITVTPVDEAPTITTTSSSATGLRQPENRTSRLYTYRATDPEGSSITWSVGGPDGNEFRISETGTLTFGSSPDYESPAGANGNEYLVTVRAQDDGLNTATLDVTVTVTPVNEPPTVSGLDTRTIDENDENFSGSYSASDPEGASTTFTWSLSGTDGGDFSISETGVLTFRNTPDYESPADSNRNNEYLVAVRASDGQYTGMLNVAVTVRDVNEAPEFTSRSKSRTSFTYPENSTHALYTYQAADPEGRTITWSVSGTDGGDFDISVTGVLTFADVPDFENPADASGDNEYLVTVQARDDGFNFDRLEVTVNVANSTGTEEPTITTTSRPALTYQENGARTVYTYSANDPQRGIITWSVTGTDAHAFTITSDSRGRGVLTFTSPPDFENPTDSNGDNLYEIAVVATDEQGLTDNFDVTVTVTNHAESVEPTISTRRPPTTYRENGTSTVYNFRASDPQRGPIAWSHTGTDASAFALSDSGELSFVSPPDFESPSDSDGQNDYELTVVAIDEDGHSDSLAFTITVTDVNEGPEITRVGSAPGSVAENHGQTQVLGRYMAIDPEDTSAEITRWDTSGRDGGDFVMNEQGELRFRYSPDYERPADSNRDNVYEVTVRAYDGRYYGTFEETITVTPVNEAPTITTTSSSATGLRQPENWTSRLYTYRATDPEGSGIAWSVGGADGRFFTIDQRGEFSFSENSPPDFEFPGDLGGDNIYNVTVQASDGTHTGSVAVMVNVTDVNEGPTVSGSETLSSTENRSTEQVLASYTGSDPESPGTPINRWSTSGTDGGDFTINENGELKFRNTPDYERPADSNRDNIYTLSVRAYDGRYYGYLEVAVTVDDLDEISGPSALDRSENFEGLLATYSAAGQGDLAVVPTWRLTGTDGGDFSISEQGELTFRATPDYERPADSNRDNVYSLAVQVSDGGYYGSRDVTVTVTPVNEAPTITTTSSLSTGLRQPENRTSRLYTYRATDPEGSGIAWSVGGADGRFFTIDQRGEFSFSENSPPDFEFPGDLGGDNIYNVTVQASDGTHTGSVAVMVNVTDVNEGPTVSGSETLSSTENRSTEQVLASYTGSDPESPGTPINRWSTSGTDGGDFTINENGELKFRNTPDYERPADSNRDNIYTLSVRAYDGRYYGYHQVTVMVRDMNEAPTITTTSRTEFSYGENGTSTIHTFRATDPEGGDFEWDVAGPDASDFSISETGVLTFSSSPDFENPLGTNRNEYQVTVQARDEQRNTSNLPVTVTVTDVNEGPEIRRLGNAPARVPENQDQMQMLARYAATDPEDTGAQITLWSTSGTDGGDFTINENGELKFRNTPDYERPADSNRDNIYEVTVRASDGRYYGTFAETEMVAVTNVNEAPTITTKSRTEFTQRENATSVLYTYRATDQDRDDVISWSVEGSDRDDFAIYDGILTFRLLPDYEIPADSNGDNEYEITVVASDSGNLRDTVDAAITITQVNEGPEIARTNANTDITVQEATDPTLDPQNQVLATYSATDPEGDDVTRWSLSGSDGGDFEISATGVLTFRNPPDYDRPADSNRDNEYLVTIRAYDAGNRYGSLDVTVTVTPFNEPPVINTGSRTEFTYSENRTGSIYTYRATDPEQAAISWSVAGVDGSFFSIDNLGTLSFADSLDFEARADFNRDNVYDITVVAEDDRGLEGELKVAVTVTDVNEGPEVSGRRAYTVVEGQELSGATYSATDPEGDDVTRWSLSGSDGGDFEISATGVLAFRDVPDYDKPADSNRDNEYLVTVRAHDAGNRYGSLDVTVTVTDVNEEAPVVTGSDNRTVSENTTSAIYTYRATDADLGDTITWSTSGADGHLFEMNEQGALSFREAPDYENPRDSGQDNVYELEVVATDSRGLTGELMVTITVTELNEGPEITGTPSYTIQEFHQSLANATYSATDPEGDSISSWRLYGSDGGDFTITDTREQTGRNTAGLRFRYPPDVDRPADSNRDNEYLVTIRAYDNRGKYGSYDVTVTVTAANEPPVITGSDARTFQENGTGTIHTYRATDPEGDAFTWIAPGGTDGHLFDISDRGVLTFRNPPDFDIEGDADRDNDYQVTVQARDDNFSTGAFEVTVTVTDVNEGPEVSGRETITVQEYTDPTQDPSLQTLATYSARDPEGSDISRWSLSGSDGGDFSINENGELTFRYAPDYDRPVDSNRDNEYLVSVRAYDVTNRYGSLDVTVTVRGENEADPVVTGSQSLSFRENTAVATRLYTYRATDADRDTTIVWSVRGQDGNNDGNGFVISDTGVLTFKEVPDYELPADSDRDNQYLVTVVATDDQGREGTLDVAVSVTEVPEGPEITAPSGQTEFTYDENVDRVVATFTARDPEEPASGVSRWSLAGSDAGDFTITDTSQQTGRNTAQLTFRDTPDYDSPADSNRDNEYLVTIRAYDRGNRYGSLDVKIAVIDENEHAPVVTGSQTLSFRENTTTDTRLYTYQARDMDRGAMITWSLEGDDRDDFDVDEGVLTFKEEPDYEQPADSGPDNEYEITVVASDGTYRGTLDVTIMVTDVNEGPEITGSTARTVSENFEGIVATYTGEDPEDTTADVTRWSVAGRDGGDFTINEGGELTFRNPPDFERPADSNRDNEYEVTVRASDGRYYGTLDVTVTVEAVNEGPEFRSGSRTSFTHRENGTSALYTYRATDPERDDLTWEVGGTDRGAFEISEDGGVLTFKTPPDFENPDDFDGDNEYLVTVLARDDQSNTAGLEVMVAVTDLNEGPEIEETPANTGITVRENSEGVLFDYSATDPEDPDAEITRWSATGTDGGDFTINGDGELSFRNVPDFERPADSNRDNEYLVTVRASDGRYYGTLEVTVRVEAVNERPEFRGGSTATFTYKENGTSDLYTYRATDPEGNDVAWGLSGTDRGAFEISETGVLSFIDPPDYESPTDSGSNNVYEVTVEAGDGEGNTAELEVTVTVTNLTDRLPVITGTAQVGRTLRADTSDIAADDGQAKVSYSYQWIRNEGETDTDIDGETDPTYTPSGSDVGKTLKVRVSFSKDAKNAKNQEALTSAATAAVAAADNHPATGLPIISGTAQVDQTLTADTSGIADEDGLTNVSYSYQWISGGSDIDGATGSSHTLTTTQQGQTIQVRVSFTDDRNNAETLTSEATGAVAAADNRPATGLPTISGTAQVGETLTADISGIADEDGLTSVSYSYQWIRSDGNTDTDIAGETASTYTLVSADVGKAIKVKVSFTDDANNAETRTSAATAAVAEAPNRTATGLPTISGTVQVGQTLTADTSGIADEDGLTNVSFSYQWIRSDRTTDTDIAGERDSTYTPSGSDVGKTIKVKVSFTDDASNLETLTSAATAMVAAKPNTAPTGLPTISGTAQVGQTLTADTTGIADADGLTNVSFSYQWIRSDGNTDTDIAGETDSTYTLVSADVGKTIKVKVSFTDDANNAETLTSEATGAVAAKPNTAPTGLPTISGTVQVGETLTADTTGIADADGLDNASYSYQWVRNDGSADADIQDATGSTYTLSDDDVGKTIKVRVSFTDDASNGETLTSAATATVAAAANSPATGAPAISGTAQVEETLTADTSGIADEDGLDDATFAYQWIRNDGNADTDIQDATSSTYSLVYDDVGRTIKVRVSFTDDASHEETLTSALTEAVTLLAWSATLTAGTRETHSGYNLLHSTGALSQTEFTLGGDDYTVKMVVEGDDGLLSFGLDRRLRTNFTLNVGGVPFSSEDASTTKTGFVHTYQWDKGTVDWSVGDEVELSLTVMGTPATGQPTINGTVQVGETLTADTSGIADADGLDDAVFSYQWIAGGTDIQDATSSTYTLDADDVGKTIKVRMSFTDNADNEETLTSAATATVAAKPNTAPTGLPIISGRVQVGETLMASTSGIADQDGLDNATFSYQWLADDSAITDATGSTYTLVAADQGKTIKVRVSFTDNADNEETLTSAATAAVAARPNSLATGAPTISGRVQVGETLTASASGIADRDGLDNATFSYQWLADDSAIPDATGSTYTLVAADEGKTIEVKVSFTDDANNAETLTSEATGAVAAKPNTAPTGLPTISGTVQVGETLTADTTGIADADGLDNASYSYQWVRNDGSADADIQDATGSTYTLSDDDVGKTIKVRVSFTDDASNGETLTSAATATVAAAANSPATGAPAISGTAQVEETLTADTSGIADEDGLDDATFAYQWIRNDGNADTDIQDATSSTYSLVYDDVGRTIKVRVSFTDDASHEETLTSALTEAVTLLAWSATLTAGTRETHSGYNLLHSTGALSQTEFTLGGDDYTVKMVVEGDDGLLSFGLDRRLRTNFTLNVGGVPFSSEDASTTKTGFVHTYQWDKGTVDWSVGDEVELSLTVMGTPATGQPTINGTVQVGETLTADTSGIADADGLDDAVFSYQWIAGGTDIQDATSSTYTLDADDVGKTIKVRMSFTDNADNEETLTSAATATVAAKPNTAPTGLPIISGRVQVGETLMASTSGIADQDGLDNATFSYQWLADDSAITDATGSTYTLVAADQGKTIKVRVSFTDNADNEETLTSAATAAVAARPNSLATGAPTISGRVQVGETLTASASGIADGDGLDNVSYSYQWIRSDGSNDTDIEGEKSSTYALVPADQGKTIKVKVSFTDDANNVETLTSAATAAVAAADNRAPTGLPTISGTVQVDQTLTADTSGIADEDGLTNVPYSYQWIAGGSDIDGATDSSHTLTTSQQGQTIQVRVSFTDDRNNAETLTSEATGAVAAAVNRPATGLPTIGGTAQVQETLTADISGIADEDGLTSVSYSYQWIRGDGNTDTDISGETASTYTLVSADVGKAIKVRIIFIDDAGNDESLTSEATAAVTASNTLATGEPTITGTAQVGEELTADTTDISDSDGLINASFTYRWLADDTDITDATGSTYTLAAADEGKAIKVRITFTDDAGNDESLTSEATAAVAAIPNSVATGAPAISGTVQVGQTLTASTSNISDSDGLTNATFTYQWIANDGTEDTDIQDATGSTYTVGADDEDKTIKVRVSFTDDWGNQETRTSDVTVAVAAAPSPSPLTAAIHDKPESHNGQDAFKFELRFSEDPKEDFSYKTLRDHAFTVTGGTVVGARRLDGDSDTPNIRWEISVSPDSNADVTVELPATEDCDAQGAICTADGTMLSIPLKFTVKGPPLTASFESVPTSHNGSDNFKFRISFSEELETNFSYKTLRDHAFTVEGGTMDGARRLVSGSNIRWEISFNPDSNGDVTIVLPATTDCNAQGAICADGDKKLSNRLERTVSGPGQ